MDNLELRVNQEPASATSRAIVIFPDLAPVEPLEAFRRRWDPLAERIAPHVTLVFPFVAALPDDELIAHAIAAIRGVPPFDMVLSEITGMNERFLIANIKKGNDPLIALHDQLYTGPLQRYLLREQTFVPHVTVGRVVDRHDFETALAEAADTHVAIETSVNVITVSSLPADGPVRILADVPLGVGVEQ